MSLPSLLLALTVRGTLAYFLVEAVDRLAARFLPGQDHVRRRVAWWMTASIFLIPFRHAAFALLPARWTLVLVSLWAVGFAALAGIFAVRAVLAQARWARKRLSTDSRLLTLLEDAKAELRITAPIGLVISGDVPAPALLGWLRPRILLPADLAAVLPPERLRAILLHELAHFAAQDLLANLLFAAVRAVHWFNPFAHLAARSWDRYREEAADAAVLERMNGESASNTYGEILLETLQHASASPLPHGAMGMGESLRNLKWRLTMIGRYRSPAGRTRWLTLLPGLTVVLAILPLPAQSPAGKPMGTDALAAEADEESKRAATTAMLPWLALEDRGDYGATWDQASRGFRDAEKRDDWIAVSKKVRPPLGKCLGRTLASANHQTDIPLAGGTIQKGEYVVAQFDASFENLKYAVETVCFQKEADGTWRASGYFIKPKA